MDTLYHSDYTENLNTKFRVTGTDELTEIELTTVDELKNSGGQESFSLIFCGGKDRFLPQGLYNLEHDSLGSGMIFLVPVGEKEKDFLYEAVFNRMKQDDDAVEEQSTGD